MVEKKGLGKAIGHAFLWFGIAIVLFPLYIALVATTHTFDVLIGSTPLWFGGEFLKNFTTVLTQGLKAAGGIPVWVMMANSLVMALGIAIGKIAISITAAYAIVYFRFPGRELCFVLIFITLMMPVEVRIVPTFQVAANLNFIDSYLGLVLPLIASATATFLYRQMFMTIPAELLEAARIELRRLHQRLATTSIYVTHDQVEAMTLAEKILVLRAGNIEQYGTPDDIYLHPASVFVAQFMGSPSMNMIPATTDGEKLILPDGTPLSGVAASDIRLAAAPSKDVLVGLRCEDLLLDPEGSVQVTVDIIEALGPDTLAYCHPITGKAGGGVSDQSAIIVRLPGTRRPAPGDAIRLSVRAGHGHVFDPASGLRCL